MAYVATRSGERAIEPSERLFRAEMGTIPSERISEITAALPYLWAVVMGEASLYDEDIAALALAQTGGELYEAVLVLRAWRTTQPRLSMAEPIEQNTLFTHRRLSAALGPPPTVNELRLAETEIVVTPSKGTKFSAGRVKVSQAEILSQKGEKLELGFAATLGWNEVKVIAAATLDLNCAGAPKGSPTEEEFFLYHTEGVESSGFCIDFTLPHYVTFQSSLDAMRPRHVQSRSHSIAAPHSTKGVARRSGACLASAKPRAPAIGLT